MTARIFLDLDKLHLIANGQWHRASLRQVPQGGEQVTMLCGLVELVEYGNTTARPPAVATCWQCDLAYRQHEGIAYLTTHPGLPNAPQPRRGAS